VVAVEHAPVDDAVFREAALQLIAVGVGFAADVDVGLHDVAVAGRVLGAQIFAGGNDCQRHFVAKHDGLLFHAAVDARVLFAGADHLDVRETNAHRVVAHQQFVRPWLWQRQFHRRAIFAEIFPASAIKRPQSVCC
jgi:hypothetical protein